MDFFNKFRKFFQKKKEVDHAIIPYDSKVEDRIRRWVIKYYRGEIFHYTKDGWDAQNNCILTYDAESKQYIFIQDITTKKNPVYFVFRIPVKRMLEWTQEVRN